MNPNPFSVVGTVQQAIYQMLTTRSAAFDNFGATLFLSLAVLIVAYHGTKMMFATHSGIDHQLFEFSKMMMFLAAGYSLVTFYHPFTRVITDQASEWAATLDAEALISTSGHFDTLLTHFIVPNALAVLANFLYWSLTLALVFAKGLSMFIVAYSLIATAICVLVGPLFVPWFIVPGMDWLFWGWFKNLLAYSFVQVVAQAYLMIGERFIYAYVNSLPAIITPDLFLAYSMNAIAVVVTFAIGILGIPLLAYGLFSGHASHMGMGGVMTVLTKR